ncbi:AAA family ATPase [Rheinheimera sp. F8]|uniref:ATP-dependent DNA helicase n=1 Tax=Rheinheimera sp. F8 TaxID=1763998 RepID=UPI000744BD9F|nr:AAA family ATPase [Rheinheimera sp. F8]ALZ76725.1 hypothetical protein ATY27_13785 [Rheinheimera sp. F8]
MVSNFDFLQHNFTDLYNFSRGAEQYVEQDPQACLVKLRCFSEQLVDHLYHELGINLESKDDFYQRLTNPQFEKLVEKGILLKLNALRINGNKAAHGKKISRSDAKWLLKEAYLVSKWFACTYFPEMASEIPDYQEPQTNSEAVMPIESKTSSVELEAAQLELRILQEKHVKALADINRLANSVQNLEALQAQFASANNAAAQQFDLETSTTIAHLSLVDAYSDFELNEDQLALVQSLEQFLREPKPQVFLLKGYAGTGKTFITKGLTEYLRTIGRHYTLMAPTGKAARVIAQKTGSPASTIHRTIYSFKDIREFKEPGVDGSETFKYYSLLRANENPDNSVYISDESSMISDTYQENEFFRFGTGYLLTDMMKFINLDHNDHCKKLIVIGDSAQLPPVGMATSPALDADYLKQRFNVDCMSYELTTVVRQQADSGVMANAIMLRETMATGVFNQLDFKLQFPDIKNIKPEELVPAFLNACNYKSVSNDAIIVSGSNADVKHYNDRIREEFFPNSPSLQPRDKLIVVKNVEIFGHLITNGEFIYVRSCDPQPELRSIPLKSKNNDGVLETRIVPLLFRGVEFSLRTESDTVISLQCKIIETLLNSEDGTLNSDQQKALYVDFKMRNSHLREGSKEFKDALMSDPYFNALRAKYGYAITVHKAQGSEWRHVFVKCKAPQFSTLSQAYFRWLYTAITRTKETLFVLDEPHILIGSGIKKASQKDFGWISQSASIAKAMTLDSATASNSMPLMNSVNQPAEISSETAVVAAIESQSDILEKQATDFGIPSGELFLVTLFQQIQKILLNVGAEVLWIDHKQYQERYLIKFQQTELTINVHYSGKNKVTKIQSAQLTEASSLISSMLNVLVDRPLAVNIQCDQNPIELPEPFLEIFHQRIEASCAGQSFRVLTVKARDYCQEYTFVRAEELATFSIFYNSKKQIKSYASVTSKTNSPALSKDVEAMFASEIK